MSAATLDRPDVPVDDVDFEAWFAGEIEKPCQLGIHTPVAVLIMDVFVPRLLPCGAPANWLAAFQVGCTCPISRHIYLCDPHKELVAALGAGCAICNTGVLPTMIERIRGRT